MDGSPPPEQVRAGHLAAHEPRLTLVAVRDGRVLGALTLNGPTLDEPVTAWFFGGVHPEHRRRGIGRALLDRAVTEAHALGATRLEVGVVRAACRAAGGDGGGPAER